MQILSLYWKCVWEGAMAGQPARFDSYTKDEQRAFDRRIALLRHENRRIRRDDG
ncbi:MAG: hypothetical protein PVG24_14850 [Gammaproteobacteria bacterium]|jgi:hypothetical protein